MFKPLTWHIYFLGRKVRSRELEWCNLDHTLSRARLRQPPQPQPPSSTAEALETCHHGPWCFRSGCRSPHTPPEAHAWDGKGAISPSSGGRAWSSRAPGQPRLPPIPGSWPWLPEVVVSLTEESFHRWDLLFCCSFSFLRAHPQALSQVRPRPGHRAVAMFPGTELQGSCFHRGEKEKEASNDQWAGSENRPLSALAQLWTQGQASASQLVTGAASRVHSQGGSMHCAKLEMRQNTTRERRGTMKL